MLPLEVSMQCVAGMLSEKRKPSWVVGEGGYLWAKALLPERCLSGKGCIASLHCSIVFWRLSFKQIHKYFFKEVISHLQLGLV